MVQKLVVFFFLISLLYSLPVCSQTDSTITDSTEEEEHTKLIDKRPRNATIMSALLPGLGQVYNKKYWKVPIIYAGEGFLFYLLRNNQFSYHSYKNKYDSAYAVSGSTGAAPFETQRDFYHKNRDLCAILFLAIYAMNILDANVDAHLRGFDIDEKLSLRFKPLFYPNYNYQFVTGLTVNLVFKK